MPKNVKKNDKIALVVMAEQALKEAVAKVIEEHRITGDPIVVWKNGKVLKIHVDTPMKNEFTKLK